ncbi:MAG: HD domain-containing protein [Nitrospirae bacterium]|nr:HD domain-containing protein [Nitrospirota bacterium]
MTEKDLFFFKKWFADFCRSFYSENADDQRNISLKEGHTHNVCSNINRITEDLSLDRNEIMLSVTIALFHDLGRFPQYAKYGTFSDSASVNHGKLGSDILNEKGVLKNLPVNEQGIILDSVRFHNAFSIPDLHSRETVLFLRLIRDADKLDIWRVFVEPYYKTEEGMTSAVNLGLPDTPEYSEKALSCIYKKEIVPLAYLKTLNDFRLLQLSWVYDLNFSISFRLLLEHAYIRKIVEYLPHTENIKRMHLLLEEFANQRGKENM